MGRISMAVVLIGSLASVGCSMGGKAATTQTGIALGSTGKDFYVNLFTAPVGGVIRSGEATPRISCGASGFTEVGGKYVYSAYADGAACGQTLYQWTTDGRAPAADGSNLTKVVLRAVPRGSNAFLGWAGDCAGLGDCTLTAGADKSVVALFGTPGSGHPNLLDPGLHGQLFKDHVARRNALDCASCHGITYAGQGIAPSCNACHARAGVPSWQTTCDFCHGAPPTSGGHPAVSGSYPGNVIRCAPCHSGTVDAAGHLVAGGKHMNGQVDASGHAANFADPAIHGPAAFAAFGTCQGCHGTDFAGGSVGVSCTACHASAGHANWLSDCTFCHGAPPSTASGHPAVSGSYPGNLPSCSPCHATTVNSTGRLVAGGTHMNGTVEASGHGDYSSPIVHGPSFLASLTVDALGTTRSSCTSCHGDTYDRAVAQGGTRSCNSCHRDQGWSSWTDNCTFCHGLRQPGTTGLTLLAAPGSANGQGDTVLTRFYGGQYPYLDRVGAHEAHLVGSEVAQGFPCQTCHVVESDLRHAALATAGDIWTFHAPVTLDLQGLGYALQLDPASAGSYDQPSATCTTYCHASTLNSDQQATSPAWAARMDWTGLAGDVGDADHRRLLCMSCHGYPGGDSTVPAGSGDDANFHNLPAHAEKPCFRCHYGTVQRTMQVPLVDTDGNPTGDVVEENDPHTPFSRCPSCPSSGQAGYDPRYDRYPYTVEDRNDPLFMVINPDEITVGIPTGTDTQGVWVWDPDLSDWVAQETTFDSGLLTHVNGLVEIAPDPWHSWKDNPSQFTKDQDGTWTCASGCHNLNAGNMPADPMARPDLDYRNVYRASHW